MTLYQLHYMVLHDMEIVMAYFNVLRYSISHDKISYE